MNRKFAGVLGALALGALSFAVLAASIAPPNLAKTLAAQQQLVVDRPYDAEVHNDHGNLLVLAGRHEEAGDAYRRAIELAPAETLARYNLGILLQQASSSKKALAVFQELLEIDARHARAHYQLGMLFSDNNQRTKAVEHYARAFAYDPELTFARNNPHIIDNHLATQALLVSDRYGDAPSSSMPRLYGEPERIVELMLAEAEESATEASIKDVRLEKDEASEEDNGESTSRYFEADDAGDREDDDSEEDEDSEDEDSEGASGRVLTREDLETSSSTGQVRRGRGSSAGRDTGTSDQGRTGSVIRPGNRKNAPSINRRSDPRGGNQGRGVPRYRPTSRLSTSRLDLELLPTAAQEQRNSATVTR